MRLSKMPELPAGGQALIPQKLTRFLSALSVLGLVLYATLVFSGAILLAADPPQVASAGLILDKACDAADNLAATRCGARLRASSVDYRRSHFVSYANDEEPRPDPREKWMPRRDDLHPWIELILYRRSDLQTMTLHSACKKEKSNLIGSKLRLVCLRDDEKTPVLDKTLRIDAADFRFALPCAKTDRVRLNFTRRLPHVYELSLNAAPRLQP